MISRSSPTYVYDYCAEVFFVLPTDNKILHHRYVTYYQKLKGYPRGFKKEDFSKFNLKAWATVPISYDEKLDMNVYLANNNVEDFTMQYRTTLDKNTVNNPLRKISITLKEGYNQQDIHTLQIRTDYGQKSIEGKIKHTNVELFDIFNNKINADDDTSFIKQGFEIPSYEWTIHYIFVQVEKYNPLIGPKYWLSPFGIHENRVDITRKLWQESGVSISLCVLSSNIYVKMIERTYNDKKEILDAEFEEIVKYQILKSKKIESENPENTNMELLSTPNGIFILPFHFFIPDEAFRHGSFKYSPDGRKQSEDRFEDMGIIFGKSDGVDKTMNCDPYYSAL